MNLEQRVERLERRNRRLTVACMCFGGCLVAAVLVGFTANPKSLDGVIHARGLVIEDSHGRARILLGAPFPGDPARLRNDTRTTAMIFLDDKGHDRLTLGEAVRAQSQGSVAASDQRIAPSFGVIIHDLDGNERGGFSFLSNGRAVVALDYPGRDAIGFSVDDHLKRAEFMLNYAPGVAGPGSAFELYQQGDLTTFSLNNKDGDPQAVKTFRFGNERTAQHD